MVIISNVELFERKDGKGKVARINYVDSSTLKKGSRPADEIFASILKPGMQVEGASIQQVKVKSYTLLDPAGKEITTDRATIVVLKGESHETAAKASGRTFVATLATEPASYVDALQA